MGVLIVPAVFGAGVYQISRFIDLAFIRALPDESLTYMAMADRWNQLPLGIIGIALGTAILPALSRYIAGDENDVAQRMQSNAIELAMLKMGRASGREGERRYAKMSVVGVT